MAGSFARHWHGEPQRLSAIELHLRLSSGGWHQAL
jgi:hypothetical protein